METVVNVNLMPYDVTVVDSVLHYDTGNPNVNIHLWSLDQQSNPWLVRIHDFPPFCFVELPTIINGKVHNWTQLSAGRVADFIIGAMKENAPKTWHFDMRQKLYYFQNDKKYPMLILFFTTLEALNHCKNLLGKPRMVNGIGMLMMNVYEANIDIVRKMFTVQDLKFCSWLSVTGEEIPFDSDRRISTKGTEEKPMRELFVSYKNILPVTSKESETWFTFPRILAFDIETYTDNHKSMPNSLNSKHVSNIISCIYYEIGKPETRKKYVFVLGDSLPVEGAEVVCLESEVKMIDAFSELIVKLDPEIISGYNIFAYDYPYLDNRLKTKMRDWIPMGRIIDKPTEVSTMKWKSGAYGYNIINILQMDGRISIDMLPIVKRDYKLDKYSLDFVSNHFIGRTKHDVKPVDMFLAYEHQMFVNEQIRKYFIENGIQVPKLLEYYSTLKTLNETNPSEKVTALIKRYEMAREEITRIVAYCIQDSDLVVDLFDKLNVWLGLNALSSVVGVPIIQLFTRGQQVRCLSQVYDKCYRKQIVLDKRIKDKVFYNGGFVFEPKPGLYDAVVCLDFASLYPSIMRAYNICFTTLVHPELVDTITDEQSETIEVEQEEPADGKIKNIGGDDNDFFATNQEEDDDEPEGKTVLKTYNYKWVKKSVRYGVLPEIQDHLVGSRNIIKKELAALEDELEECTDPKRLAEIKLLLVLKDKYSNALKVSANSLYGFLGAQEGGVLSLIEAAMCITSKGRNLIKQVNSYIENKYKGDVVYGDSVTHDTPILIRENGSIQWIQIQELGLSRKYTTTIVDGKERIYEQDLLNVEVWSDKGWTRIKEVIRHRTDKNIFRIKTKSGLVYCTEDHSLVLPNGEEISPKDVRVGDKLLHSDLPMLPTDTKLSFHEFNSSISEMSNQRKFNSNMMNTSIEVKGEFLLQLQENENLTYTYDIDSAQVYHLMNNFVNFTITPNVQSMNEIVEISNEGPTTNYVYDLETENHHFAAGVGRIVVHNTDSSMVDLHIPDFKEAYAMGLKLADEISGTPEKKLSDGTIIPEQKGLFPPPLKIEFEKCLRILCIKKKKYAGLFIGKDGEFIREKNKDGSLGEYKVLKRGIIVARRDTAKIVHKTYNNLLNMILIKEPIYNGFNLLMKTIDDLINDRISVRDNLSIIRSLGDNYKSESYFMKIFGDELTRVGKPANPSDRLDYVIVKTKAEEEGEKGVKLGLKMRLTEMYEDSQNAAKGEEVNSLSTESVDSTLILSEKDPINKVRDSIAVYPAERIDYEYYISHIMQACLDQLFSIGYMRELEKYKDICYTPQFCRLKPAPVSEPIGMIAKVIEDYSRKGYTIDQIKHIITYMSNHFEQMFRENS